jgi:transcription elongation factor GreA
MELPVMQKLRKEVDELRYELKTKLPKELEKARAHGDLSENAEYEAAKERQGYVSARLAQMEQRMRELSMYSVESIPRDKIAYGSRVTIENLDNGETQTFEIVFPEEVDAAEGRISLGSPMGRALLNKQGGDEVEVQTPKGKHAYQIVELQTLHERKESASR